MKEGFAERYTRSVQLRMFGVYLFSGLCVIGLVFVFIELFGFSLITSLLVACALWIILSGILSILSANAITKPMRYLSQAILHVTPGETIIPAPNLEELTLGREMVASLARQVYDFASSESKSSQNSEVITPSAGSEASGAEAKAPAGPTTLDLIPIPLLGIDSGGKIVMANAKANELLKNTDSLEGSQLDQIASLEFNTEDTLDNWLKDAKQKSVAAARSWTKVRLTKAGTTQSTYFDIAANLSQEHASGVETMLAFFDHSDAYSTEEDAMSFVALAVHELRTPLTVLRGFIEAIDEELGPHINEETRQFIYKMNISAETLSGFVNKILNVAKIEENQLSLHLTEDNWVEALKILLSGLQTRAWANDKIVAFEVGEDIPTVAIDRIAISEVVSNLVDNAIKYSPKKSAQTIAVKTYVNSDGLVETTVQDHGLGIPSSVMPHLFTKFYRNHRNANQIGGTGLGLYLSKAIVSAHHGHIWAQSKEGEGSTFGFTILPYDQLAEAEKTNDNGISRQRHGWIKNHTMQRQ